MLEEVEKGNLLTFKGALNDKRNNQIKLKVIFNVTFLS